MELERIYGIKEGRPEKLLNNSAVSKTQDNLASELGMSVDKLNRFKQLAQAIPEMHSLVESGKVTKSVALSL